MRRFQDSIQDSSTEGDILFATYCKDEIDTNEFVEAYRNSREKFHQRSMNIEQVKGILN